MSRSSSLRALPTSELGIVRFPTVRIGDAEGMAHLPIDGCDHTGRLRRTVSPRSFALPVASLHDRFGSYGRSTTFSSTEVITSHSCRDCGDAEDARPVPRPEQAEGCVLSRHAQSVTAELHVGPIADHLG